MFLLEHDAKQLLARHGVPAPGGAWVGPRGEGLDACAADLSGPQVLKAQVQGGGRGRAGGIRKVASPTDLAAAIESIAGPRGRLGDGRPIAGFRVESVVEGAQEAYLSLAVDPAAARIRVMVSARGGVDIEQVAAEWLVQELAPLDPSAIARAVRTAVARLPGLGHGPHAAAMRETLAAAGDTLAAAFVDLEAQLIEINPLFVFPDGGWLAGDAKVVTDDSALGRQGAQRALLERAGARYEDVDRKWRHGCDYVVVDPDGEIGLLTTGAGLSMMLIDELRARGLKPYNFLDVRTGGLRGDPRRLVDVLQWMTAGSRLRVLLVNIFAGITDLGEFASLLGQALEAVPALRVPVVARLVGPGLDAAREQLAARGIEVETDLDRAVARVRERLGEPCA